MGRSGMPPAHIVAPTASAMATTESILSDLPLRKFHSPPRINTSDGPGLPPTPPEGSPGITEFEIELPSPDGEQGPDSCSAIVGSDCGRRDSIPLLFNVAGPNAQAHNRSRSRSGKNELGDPSWSTTSLPPSRSASKPSQHTDAEQSTRDGRPGRKVKWYLDSVAKDPPLDPIKELLRENTGLQQRISALQRVERELLDSNHQLGQQLVFRKQRHHLQREKWREEHRGKVKALEARIKELEGRVAQRDNEMTRLAARQKAEKDKIEKDVAEKLKAEKAKAEKTEGTEPALSDDEVAAWFTSRTKAWQGWVKDFAHHDPQRVQAGLHPVQLLQLCDSVKSFVKVTDEGLPEAVLEVDSNNGFGVAHILLNGMLANFIITEILQSPLWIFTAMSASKFDLDSPSVIHPNSESPIGFRMDLAMWWNSVAPPRSARLPQPVGPRIAPEVPRNGLLAPPQVSGMPSLTLNTAGLSDLSNQSLPGRDEMEHLFQLLSEVQQHDCGVHVFRSQLVRTLSEGGLSLEVAKAHGDGRRRLADARVRYAKKLKDRFLGGAARFLLEDQDPIGIEKLEKRLEKELDEALRFSCHVWSRRDPIQCKGLSELAGLEFTTANKTMELCQGQAPILDRQEESRGPDMPPAYHEGHTVVMVAQPVIESIAVGKRDGKGPNEPPKIVSKARVIVTAPKPGFASTPLKSEKTSMSSPPPTTGARDLKANVALVVPPKGSPELLLGVAFKPLLPATSQRLAEPSSKT